MRFSFCSAVSAAAGVGAGAGGVAVTTIPLYAPGRIARTADTLDTNKEFTVEPEFKITGITVYGPTTRRVTFQGKPAEATATDGSKWTAVVPDA